MVYTAARKYTQANFRYNCGNLAGLIFGDSFIEAGHSLLHAYFPDEQQARF